jgi:transposase-like protein
MMTPTVWERLHSRITAAVRRYLGDRSVRGTSAEDLASQLILNLLKRESGRRLVARTAGRILAGELPTPLFLEARRLARRLRATASEHGIVDLARHAPDPDEWDGPVSAFVCKLALHEKQVLVALAEEQPTEEILAKQGITERTLRHWRQQLRKRAAAAGLRPAVIRTKYPRIRKELRYFTLTRGQRKLRKKQKRGHQDSHWQPPDEHRCLSGCHWSLGQAKGNQRNKN